MSARWLSFAIALALPSLCAVSAQAQTQPKDQEVRRSIDAARRLAAERDFGGAFIRLSRAYDVTHDPQLLVEMGACEEGMQRNASALRLLDRALIEGGSDALTAAQVSAARDVRNAALPLVGRVRVSVDVPGATIQVDDQDVGQSPLATDVWVDTGPRTLRVAKAGYRDVVTSMTIYATSERELDVKLEPDVPLGRLRIETSPKNTVVVDGIVGYGNWDGCVSAAVAHSVQITAPGMNAFETDVKVPANMSRTFDVKLQPDRGAPAWLWVVGSTVLVATAVVAAVVVLHSDSSSNKTVASSSSGLQIKWP